MAETEHHPFGPSSWDRNSTCPGALRLSERFPDSTSEYAAEGTAAHEVRERCLKEGKDVAEFVGQVIEADGYPIEVKAEWIGWLQPGIDRIRDEGGELWVERKVSLDPWIPGAFGTSDAIIILGDYAIIDDLKFGRGMVVDAEDNGQGMLYGLGAWNEVLRHRPEVKRVLIRIDQPRVPGGGSEWWTTVDHLLAFGEIAAQAWERTQDPDAPLVVSPKGCQFCKVAENAACPELHRVCLDLMGLDPEHLDRDKVPEMPDIDQLTPEKRSYIIEHAKVFSKWLDSVKTLQLNKALAGEETPGFKAVETQGNRQWRNEAEAEEFWTKKMPKREVLTRKLKSPAQMELVAGTRNWQQAQELIVRETGRPALVPEKDPRPALIPLTDLLDDLDEVDAQVEEELDELI